MSKPPQFAPRARETLTWKERFKAIGPGAFVAAGIIGPGTVTTFSVVGADWRYAGLWVIVVGTVIAYVFLAPALRLASVSNESLMDVTRTRISKTAAVVMFAGAFIGALAFQTGNFVGAGMAANMFLPGLTVQLWATITAFITLVIVWVGVYRLLENVMTVAVALMALAFVITAVGSAPRTNEIIVEGFQFSTLGGDWILIGALIATTVVPTGALALSSMLKRKNAESSVPPTRRLKRSQFDLRLNVIMVGLIGVAVCVTSGTVIYTGGSNVESAADMAEQLTPLLGRYAGVLFALGLFVAGITSGLYHATLQPLLLCEATGKEYDGKSSLSRGVGAFVLVVPVGLLWLFGETPVELIVTAQAVNALVLPMVAIIMAILVRKSEIFGSLRYNTVQFTAFLVVVGITLLLGLRVLIGFFI